MAPASVTLITQGWSGDQRRALVNFLDDRQVPMVRTRIQMERDSGRFETHEADEAVRYLDGRGADGTSSFGIVEYVAAVLFGKDPVFRDRWQQIRRMERAVA